MFLYNVMHNVQYVRVKHSTIDSTSVNQRVNQRAPVIGNELVSAIWAGRSMEGLEATHTYPELVVLLDVDVTILNC